MSHSLLLRLGFWIAASAALSTAAAQRSPLGRQQSSASAPSDGGSGDYLIGPGDVLQISVWKEPDASVPNVVVRPDGRIALPLVKELEVAGKTSSEVEREIVQGLSKYVNSPNVTVIVSAVNSKRIHVLGAVKKEGPIICSANMTVLEALSEAGGLSEWARRDRIYVLRNENGKERRLPFNYERVISGKNYEQNVQLKPGDMVIVPN